MLPVIFHNVMLMLSKGYFIHFLKNIQVNKITLLHYYNTTLRLQVLYHYIIKAI